MSGFQARKLIEIKEFDDILNRHKNSHIIPNDLWDNAVCFIKEKYATSKNLHLFLAMIEHFEKANASNKYYSDFDVFLQDCDLEDFYQIQEQVIFVSTIHKAKGREFDQAFIAYIHNKPQISEDNKRVLYVAFTRAKNDLYFICNNAIFKKPCFMQDKHLIYDNHYMDITQERHLSLYLGLRDVNLGFFTKQYNIPYVNTLIAGEKVTVTCHNALIDNKKITQFSKIFQEQLANYLNKGYHIIGGEINFIVAWFDANTQQTYRVVLPVVHLHRPLV